MFWKDFLYVCLSWPAALDHRKFQGNIVTTPLHIYIYIIYLCVCMYLYVCEDPKSSCGVGGHPTRSGVNIFFWVHRAGHSFATNMCRSLATNAGCEMCQNNNQQHQVQLAALYSFKSTLGNFALWIAATGPSR